MTTGVRSSSSRNSAGSSSSACITNSSNSLGGRSGGGSEASASLRSSSRRNSGSGISRPISATVAQAVRSTTATAPASSARTPPSPVNDGGLKNKRTRPRMSAVSAAARRGGPKVSLMRSRLERLALSARPLPERGLGGVGPVAVTDGRQDGALLPGSVPASPPTQQLVREEVRRIVDSAEHDVIKLLENERGRLDALARALLERETLDQPEAYEVAGVEPSEAQVTTR